MIKTIGLYSNTNYGFVDGSRTVTLVGLGMTLVKEAVKAFTNYDKNTVYTTKAGWKNCTLAPSAPSSAPVAGAPSAGGSVTAGLHDYSYTFLYASGDESLPSPVSNQVTTVTGNLTVALSGISTGNQHVVGRNIYRNKVGFTSRQLVGTINDNTTTVFSDTIADASLGVDAPTATYAFDITLAGTFTALSSTDRLNIEVEFQDPTVDDVLGVQKVINLAEPELPPASAEVSTISDTNLATTTTTYFYEIHQSDWRNLVMHLTASCSGTGGYLKLYKTYDPAAVDPTNGVGTVPSNTAWYDCTEEKMGFNEVSVIGPVSLNFCKNLSVSPDGQVVDMPDRYLLSWRPTNTSNVINVNVRKF